MFILLFSSIAMSSCVNLKNSKVIQQKEYIERIKNESVKSIINKDIQGLKKLFCNHISDTEYLNKNIENFFNYINNNTNGIEFTNFDWSESSAHGTTDGKGFYSLDFKSYSLNNVRINNKMYFFTVSFYDVFEAHPEYIGVINIGFTECLDTVLKRKIYYPKEKITYFGVDIFNINYLTNSYERIFDRDSEYMFNMDIENDR